MPSGGAQRRDASYRERGVCLLRPSGGNQEGSRRCPEGAHGATGGPQQRNGARGSRRKRDR
eukprot:13309560-Alexandrium_andersonii.AAC.1